ncbi:type II toxin-antitoxin system Phd/YefM family antitoxin [Gordonia sp. NPDC003504]
MSEVGIRALKQNASAVVAEAAAGETVTITDRGRPVAQTTAIPARFSMSRSGGRQRRLSCVTVSIGPVRAISAKSDTSRVTS